MGKEATRVEGGQDQGACGMQVGKLASVQIYEESAPRGLGFRSAVGEERRMSERSGRADGPGDGVRR